MSVVEKKPTISCIIPVFNEEKTVVSVVKTTLASKLFCQVICVNDSSKDQTLPILKSFGKKITLINFKKNYGKGAAMAAGLKKSKGKIVVFLDADLLDLRKKHLQQLINPLLEKTANMTRGLIIKFGLFNRLAGQRAYFRQDLLSHCQALRKKRYSAEVYLNDLFKDKKTKSVHLRGLKVLLKPQKIGLNQEMINAYLKEALEISQEIVQQQGKSVRGKVKLQRKVIKEFLRKYLKRTKEIEELLAQSKTFQKLKKLLEL